MRYKNTTGWTVNMFGKYGEKFSIAPYQSRDIKISITVIPEGVIREQKIITRKMKEEPTKEKETKEDD